MKPMEALDTAISQFDGNITQFSRAIGVAQNAPHNWKARGSVPIAVCPAIEAASRTKARAQAEIVLCEYLQPTVPWDILRRNPLGRKLKSMATQAQRNFAKEAGNASLES